MGVAAKGSPSRNCGYGRRRDKQRPWEMTCTGVKASLDVHDPFTNIRHELVFRRQVSRVLFTQAFVGLVIEPPPHPLIQGNTQLLPRRPWLTYQYTQTLIRQSLIKNSLQLNRTGFHRLVYGTTEAAVGMQTQEMEGIAPRALGVRASSAEDENWV